MKYAKYNTHYNSIIIRNVDYTDILIIDNYYENVIQNMGYIREHTYLKFINDCKIVLIFPL